MKNMSKFITALYLALFIVAIYFLIIGDPIPKVVLNIGIFLIIVMIILNIFIPIITQKSKE